MFMLFLYSNDNVGREVVALMNSNLFINDTLWTDSNGRQMVQRK